MALEFKLKLFPKKKSAPTSSIIEKDVEGIVVEISSTGGLQVSVKDTFYPIHPDCYSTKGKRRIYKKDAMGRWYEYDRPYFDDRIQNNNYVPFRPKLAVKGNIVIKDNVTYFKIRTSWVKNNIDSYNEAMKDITDE